MRPASTSAQDGQPRRWARGPITHACAPPHPHSLSHAAMPHQSNPRRPARDNSLEPSAWEAAITNSGAELGERLRCGLSGLDVLHRGSPLDLVRLWCGHHLGRHCQLSYLSVRARSGPRTSSLWEGVRLRRVASNRSTWAFILAVARS